MAVSAMGLPVLRDSAATNSSACGLDGVGDLQQRAAAAPPGWCRATTRTRRRRPGRPGRRRLGADRRRCANTSPVQGSIRSVVAPSAASTSSPPMKLRIGDVSWRRALPTPRRVQRSCNSRTLGIDANHAS